MPTYNAPRADMDFILQHVFPLDAAMAELPDSDEYVFDVASAVLDEAAKLYETLLAPLNQQGDEIGCQFNNGEVTTPPGFKEAYQTYQQAGWSALSGSLAYGGQAFPHMINVLTEEMASSSNVSFSLYPGLTHGVCQAIEAHANKQLKQTYLPKMVSGEWTGVMCLTESHCGTDLGLLRTKAEPQADGSYHISGTKIFITGGEHDLTDNIVHLVLARTPDAPAGVKGISLFLVSKNLVDANGELGERNGVSCGAIEHKMGLKGSATCVMNYDNAVGFLVGELNKGLACMFTVMNIERLAIGIEGLGLAEVAYQNAAQYARERLQGRAATGAKYPDQAADPILVHPDVRRMLLTIRAYNEGSRALAIWTGRLADFAYHHQDATVRQQNDTMLALFTPVIKTFFSDYGFDACNLALQVLGGHGYVSEWGMEQFVRDARIAQIYEGANGIQALDLVKRKLLGDKGAGLKLFTDEVDEFIAKNTRAIPEDLVELVQQAFVKLQDASQFIMDNSAHDKDLAGSASYHYLHLFAHCALAYMWLQMLAASHTDGVDKTLAEAKQQVGAFYLKVLLPKVDGFVSAIKAGSEVLMTLPDDAF